VLVLAVAGLLAVVPPPDTTLRSPGTTLRFGTTEAAAAARGFSATSPGTHHGRARFFGIESGVTLTFAEGRLARAEFEVPDAAPYQISYVEDQLTRMGYRRRCRTLTPKARSCDWSGPARVHLEVNGALLKTTAEYPTPGGDATATAPAAPAAPRGPNAGEIALARLRGTPLPGLDTARVVIPPAPAAAAPHAAARDSSRAPGVTTVAGATVPMLPETLAVQIPNRPSRYAAAEVASEARPVYPEAARRAGLQGRVWVLALVDTDGRVLEARVARSSIATLDPAAVEAARRYVFKPRSWQGAPCRFRVEVPVTFTLY